MAEKTNLETSKSKKEFVLDELKKIYQSFSHLSRTDRILSYLDFFCKNFNYDKPVRESYLKSKKYSPETYEQNQNALFTLFAQKKGVCMQFAQAMSLLSVIDNSISHDMPKMIYTAGLIQTSQHPKLGHALNLIFLEDSEPIAIDISSMIHARDKEFSQDKMAFVMVYFDKYIQNLEKENVKFLATENGQSLQCYDIKNMSAEKLFDFLNKPIEKMTKIEKSKIFYFNLKKKS